MRFYRLKLNYLLTVAVALLAFSAAAQQRVVPESRPQVMLSYAPLVQRTAPAVVNIYTSKKVQVKTSPFLSDPIFNRFFGGSSLLDGFFGQSQGLLRQRERVVNSLGSGVIISPDGLVLTNLHVVKGSDAVRIVLSDDQEQAATLVLADEKTDLALLQMDLAEYDGELPYIPMTQQDDLQVGDIVLAIGNPFGVGQTVTSGIVSALARSSVGIADYEFFIQTDAAINPGNSGGALINMRGELVGVNTAIFTRGGGSNGIGFATPAIMARVIVAGYQKGNAVKRADGTLRIIRPWLGAATQNMTRELAESMGLKRISGVLVQDIYPKSSAEKAGLQRGDVLVAVDGHPVRDEQSLKFRMATTLLNRPVKMDFLRNGTPRSVTLVTEPAAEYPPRDIRHLKGQHVLDGAVVANLSPALAEELGHERTQGVVVLALEKGLAMRFLKEGDVILAINNHAVKESEELETLAAALPPHQTPLQVVILRGDQQVTLNVGL